MRYALHVLLGVLWVLAAGPGSAAAGDAAKLCLAIKDADDKSREWECRAFVDKDQSACRRIDPSEHPVSRVFCDVLYAKVLPGDDSACGSLESTGASRARSLKIPVTAVAGKLRPRAPHCRAVAGRDAKGCARVPDTEDRKACVITVGALAAADREAAPESDDDAWVVVPPVTEEVDDAPIVRIDADAWAEALTRAGIITDPSTASDPFLHASEGPSKLGEFRATWAKSMVFPCSQGAFLDAKRGDVGICQAMAMDWIRERENGGVGFGDREEPGGPGKMTDTEFTSMSERAVELQKLQADVDENAGGGRMHSGMNAAIEGRDGWGDMCFRDVGRSFVGVTDDTEGDEIFAGVLKRIRACSVGRFVMNLHGKVDPETGQAEGHGIAIEAFGGGEIRVMDPNVGTFSFTDEPSFLAWGKALYASLYQGNYRGYSLTGSVG